MDRGLYGTCTRCNGAIASARLHAVPQAVMCAACARTAAEGSS
jgi:RNA polymerase-binding transcription factor DksA